MSQGARNWPFLTFTTRPVLAAAISRSVCRHRKAGICSTSTTSATRAHCAGLVHVGDDGQAERLADLGEHGSAPSRPDAALAREAGAVGLVEGRLVDEADAEPRRDLLQRGGHLERVRAAFHLAGAGEHRDRPVVGERDVADGDGRHWAWLSCSCRPYSMAWQWGQTPCANGRADCFVRAQGADPTTSASALCARAWRPCRPSPRSAADDR